MHSKPNGQHILTQSLYGNIMEMYTMTNNRKYILTWQDNGNFIIIQNFIWQNKVKYILTPPPKKNYDKIMENIYAFEAEWTIYTHSKP